MKFLTKFIKRINPNVLGRWNINYDANIINKKVDQANTDNCGCCTIINLSKENNDLESDEYLKPFLLSGIS